MVGIQHCAWLRICFPTIFMLLSIEVKIKQPDGAYEIDDIWFNGVAITMNFTFYIKQNYRKLSMVEQNLPVTSRYV